MENEKPDKTPPEQLTPTQSSDQIKNVAIQHQYKDKPFFLQY